MPCLLNKLLFFKIKKKGSKQKKQRPANGGMPAPPPPPKMCEDQEVARALMSTALEMREGATEYGASEGLLTHPPAKPAAPTSPLYLIHQGEIADTVVLGGYCHSTFKNLLPIWVYL